MVRPAAGGPSPGGAVGVSVAGRHGAGLRTGLSREHLLPQEEAGLPQGQVRTRAAGAGNTLTP